MTSNSEPRRDSAGPARDFDANRDPITGATGAHPVGTGLGATAGGLAGAAVGSLAGPIGTAVGAAAGAIAGGLAGKGAGEVVNPTEEDAYWQSNFATRPYIRPGASYSDFAPAYRYGWESFTESRAHGLNFEQAEPSLRERWARRSSGSSLDWAGARDAVRDAWTRLQERWEVSDEARDSDAGSIDHSLREPKGAKQVRSSLNQLIQICKDGAMGFRLAAEKAAPAHASLFQQFASERDAFATELQDEVRVLGGDPENSGDTAGALHRGWINIKAAISSGDKAIIDECERGEDAAVEAYQKALRANPPSEIYAVVARQYTKVKSAHDRVSALKHTVQ